MGLLEDLREAFGRARWPRPSSESYDPERALDQLTPDIVLTLARLVGQTVDELSASFELLPVGTRLALSNAGAIQLRDEDGEHFALRALPTAPELVTAAAERVADASSVATNGDLRAELKRISAERIAAEQRFAVEEPPADLVVAAALSSDDSAEHLIHAAEASSVLVGVVRARALAEEIDPSRGIGWLSLKDVHYEHACPVRVAFPLAAARSALAPGADATVMFAVRRARAARSRRSSRWDTEELSQALRTAVNELPGHTLIHVESAGSAPSVSFVDQVDDANGIAEVASVGSDS
jgi:hypothetical protein